MAIRSIEISGNTFFFVADDLGMLFSFGYETEAKANEVATLIESSEGLAAIPEGIDIETAIGGAVYKFATDSESGTITAIDFTDARRQLDEMVPASAIADGAWGWVEDQDGHRYEVGND